MSEQQAYRIIYAITYPLQSVIPPTYNDTGLNVDLHLMYVPNMLETPYGPISTAAPDTHVTGIGMTPYIPRNPVMPDYTRVPR